jgi:asparagine synthase (glutamine-hydrolysing)
LLPPGQQLSAFHGIIRFDGAAVSRADLERQANALAYRGPDRRKLWSEGPVGLGHLLMRVTVEEYFDAQPVHDAQAGLALVGDLRLDNREDIAGKLAIDAQNLRELPDSALLLQAYRRWGPDCVEHLIGDFSFAVWDKHEQKLVLARDPMGQRPFAFYRGKDFFAFASEAKALWCIPEVPRKLSEIGMAKLMLFAFQREDRLSNFDEVGQFEGLGGIHGGTIMTVTADGEVSKRLWCVPHADPQHVGHDEAYYIENYRRILAEAVACRVRRTIHPAALLLGGGFDSGAIAGLAGPVVTEQGRKLIAVSSVMPDSVAPRPGNARQWVELLARHMPHLDVHYVTREGLDIFNGMTERFVRAGGLHGPNGYVNEVLYKTARAAGARVVMDGFGGDYTLNPRAPAWLVRLLLTGHFRLFLSEFHAYRRRTRQSLLLAIRRQIIDPLLPASFGAPYSRYRKGLHPFGPYAPLSGGYLRRLRKVGIRPVRTGAVNQFGDQRRLWARALARHQLGGMARRAASYGLDSTSPYHDRRVVEFALAIPEELYGKNGRSRYLARTALNDVYPPEFQTRGEMNDDWVPDRMEMIARVRPRVLAEIDRMQREGRLTRYFDFKRMRAMLTGRNENNKITAPLAIRSFLHACAIEWFERDNRPPQ